MPPKKKIKTDAAKPSCALVGGDGSLSFQAATEYFSTRCEFKARESFEEVFKAVQEGDCRYGMVPIENSHSGSLFNVYNLLTRHRLFIVGEHASKDEPCLLGPEGMALADITRVYSHPTVLSNCSLYLKSLHEEQKLQFDQISVANTSVGCGIVSQQTIKGSVAISSRRSAAIYGLEVLQDIIANESHLTTRYIILAKEPAEVTKMTNVSDRKHSLALTVENAAGSIFKMLSPFAFRSINVLKLDSRPASTAQEMFSDGAKHWEYVHFLDFEPSMDQKKNDGLMRDLSEYCTSVRDFGEYPKWTDAEHVAQKHDFLFK